MNSKKVIFILLILSNAILFPQQNVKINIAPKAELLINRIANNINGVECAKIIFSTRISGLKFHVDRGLLKEENVAGAYSLYVKNDITSITILKTGSDSLKINLSDYGIQQLHTGQIWQFVLSEGKENELIPVRIQSVPDKAAILIDNSEMGETDKELLLYSGTHKLKLSKEGYCDTTQIVKIEKNVNYSLQIALAKSAGILKIQVIPKDAEISINREDYSNQNEIELSPGKYKIEISKKGYNKISEIIRIKSGATISKTYNLAGKFGNIQLTVSPLDAGVKLLSDGKLIRTWKGSNIEKEIPIGEYYFEITASGYDSVKKKITVTEDNTSFDEITLRALTKVTINVDKSNMVFIEGGTFNMGTGEGSIDEGPVHSVKIKSFYMDKYEVTVMEYRKFCNSIGKEMPLAPRVGWNDNEPICNVNWEDANKYAEWIGKRLPTEAEWEFAAKGGVKSISYKYSGSNNIENVAWFSKNSEMKSHTIGLKQPNELALFDMCGNVSEWCQDWYSSIYYQNSPKENPSGPQGGITRVFRGGSWDSDESKCRVTARGWGDPESMDNSKIGFRLVCDIIN